MIFKSETIMTRIEIMKRRTMGERLVLTVMGKMDSERDIKG